MDASTTSSTTRADGLWVLGAALAAVALWLVSATLPTAFLALLLALFAATLVYVTYRRPEFGIVALIGVAALDVVGRVAEVAGAVLTAYQAAVVLVAAVIVWRVLEGTTEWVATRADLPVLLLLAFSAAAIPAATQPMTAVVSWVSLVSSVALLYLVVLAVDSADKGWLVLWSLLLITGAFGVLAVAERMGIWSIQPFFKVWSYGIRARVTFKDPNIFGSFLAGSLALTLPVALATKGWFKRIVAAGCILAGMAGLAFTFSRGAWVGFVAGVFIVLLFSRVPPALKIGVVVAAVVVVTIFLIRFVDPTFVQTKILNVSSNRSFLFRLYLGAAGLRMFLDHPMGIGTGNWPLVFPYYRPAFVNLGLVESHTAYITVLAETGIFGFVGFMWLIVRFWFGTLKVTLASPAGRLQAVAVGSLAGGTALLVQSLTYSLETSKFLWLTLGLGMAAMRIYADMNKEGPL